MLQFYRQVVYDHFSHFNEHYPDFNLELYGFEILEMTAESAYDSIRQFRGEVVDWWSEQYDHFAEINYDYIIFQTMSKTGTFPFPPIILDPSLIKNVGWNECGLPYHLIEGTHRVSYLRHILEKKIISPMSLHKFVFLHPLKSNS